MKHLSLSCLSLLASVSLWAQSSTIDINGTPYPVDTTMQYQAGPGVWHTRFTVNKNGTKHNLYLLEVDLANPYNTVEEYQSQSEMGKTETMASAYRVLDAENHRTIGGVNCNFWVVAGNISADISLDGCQGQPFAGSARHGVMIGNPSNWNAGHGDRGYVMVDRDKKVWIDNMDFRGTMSFGEQTYQLREVNRTRFTPNENEIVLFNHYLGKQSTRATDGIEVVFRTSEWRMNGAFECEVTAVNTKGGTLLTEGMGALQGRGIGKEFLSALKEGDRFLLNLEVVSTNDENLHPDILQMVTGNGLVMANGELTNRNTNEGYNNQNYPRTMLATDASHTRLYMLVAEKPGMFTADMCGILKNCGAAFAAGLDGGGSAQMCLDGAVINPTTEGAPRAVANSFWVFSTAPDDEVVTTISTAVKTITLPRYGVFRPTFMSYNQYGTLINRDQSDVLLSCDKATGYIDEQGYFVCLGDGVLTATCQDAKFDIQIRVDNAAKPTIRLDSVLISDDKDYTIEVTATIAHNTMLLQPAALSWTVADETVCTVTKEGVLKGLRNGSTWVYGTLEGFIDSIFVNVEIPEFMPLLWNTFFPEDWTVKASNTAWNTVLRKSTSGTAELYMNYTGGRQANIKLTANARLYSLPDYIELRFRTNGFPISAMIVTMKANNGNTVASYKCIDIAAEGESSVTIPIDSLVQGNGDIAIYPVWLQTILLQLDMNAPHQEYTMDWEGIWLHYGEISVGFDGITAPSFMVYPNPAENILNIMGLPDTPVEARLYDLQGHLLLQTVLQGNGQINVEQLSQGNYLLKIGTETLKLIRK